MPHSLQSNLPPSIAIQQLLQLSDAIGGTRARAWMSHCMNKPCWRGFGDQLCVQRAIYIQKSGHAGRSG